MATRLCRFARTRRPTSTATVDGSVTLVSPTRLRAAAQVMRELPPCAPDDGADVARRAWRSWPSRSARTPSSYDGLIREIADRQNVEHAWQRR